MGKLKLNIKKNINQTNQFDTISRQSPNNSLIQALMTQSHKQKDKALKISAHLLRRKLNFIQ